MENLFIRFSEKIVDATPDIFTGLVVLLAFWIAAVVSEKTVFWTAEKAHVHKQLVFLLGRVFRIALIITGLVTALGTMGVDVSALVAGLGLTGFALGFALKDALSNVLAGALILIYRPFAAGNHIKVSGYEGAVIRIDLRYTTIQAEDKHVLIPNSNLFNNPVELLNPKRVTSAA